MGNCCGLSEQKTPTPDSFVNIKAEGKLLTNKRSESAKDAMVVSEPPDILAGVRAMYIESSDSLLPRQSRLVPDSHSKFVYRECRYNRLSMADSSPALSSLNQPVISDRVSHAKTYNNCSEQPFRRSIIYEQSQTQNNPDVLCRSMKTGNYHPSRSDGEPTASSEYSCAVRLGSFSNDQRKGNIIRWKSGQLIGRGTFGKVYSACTESGQVIAVKQMQLNCSDYRLWTSDVQLISKEVQLLKSLKHPNIIEFFDCGLDSQDNTISILMEHVPGGSIASLIKKCGPFNETKARSLTRQTVAALVYLHSQNLVHLDIKGSNIMVTTDGRIKLIDFGTAKKTSEDSITPIGARKLDYCIKGSPYWIAPEIILMIGEATCKADVWSLGCTVIEMVTGAPPYFHMQPMSALFAIGSMEKPSPMLDECFSEPAKGFVDWCLTKPVESRPSSSQLANHIFCQVL